MTMRSGVTIGWAGLGLVLLVACSADTETIEDTTSSEALWRGGRSGPDARRHGRHDRGHRHGHGKGHGHGHGKGGGPGAGGSGGTNSAGGGGVGQGGGAGTGSGSGANTSGGTSGASSGGTGNFGGTGGSFGGTGGSFGGTGGSPDPGVCGDGVWSFLEQCDDANLASGDGCDAVCQIEPGFTCDFAECREVVCGDSLQDFFAVGGGLFDFEECDDGNDAADDGCSATCDVEIGFVCLEPGVPCREVVCGDGFQDSYFVPGEGGSGGTGGGSAGSGTGAMGGFAGSGGGGTFVFESCDDGNVTPGDGCSATCDLEDGFICDRPGVPCREPRCGDGFIDFIPGPDGSGGTGGTASGGASGSAGMGGGGTFEECDDGNAATSDGCTASCTVEPGFACPEAGNPCHAIVCGDGMADWPDEECDDGNVTPDDGCTDCTFDGGGGSGGFGGTFGMGGGPTAGSAPTAGSGG